VELAPMLVAVIDRLQLRRLASCEQELRLAGPLQAMLSALRQGGQRD
jgi:hypothetical protein